MRVLTSPASGYLTKMPRIVRVKVPMALTVGRAFRAVYAPGGPSCGIHSTGRCPFHQSAEEDLVDPAVESDLAVDLHDRNHRPEPIFQFGIGIDIDRFNDRQEFEVLGENSLGVV